MESRKKSQWFENRLAHAEPFEAEVEAYLIRTGVEAKTRNGTEFTHGDFAGQLRTRTDPVSKSIRFAPDGVAIDDEGLFYWDAKTSMNGRPATVERDSYEAMMKLHESVPVRVKLYIRPYHPQRETVYWNYIENVRFRPSEDVVTRFPEEKRFPIIDGWISPRAANRFAGYGSGTPYREIDLTSMIQIYDFYPPSEEQVMEAIDR